MNARWRDLTSRINPSCRDVMGLFSRTLDRPSNRVDWLIIAVHRLHCPACRRSQRQIVLLIRHLRRFSVYRAGDGTEAIPGLPPEVRERIKRALRER